MDFNTLVGSEKFQIPVLFLVFFAFFVLGFLCTSFVFFVRRFHRNRYEEKQNLLYSNFRNFFRSICLIYFILIMTILTLIIKHDSIMNFVNSHPLFFFCIIVSVILIVQIHQLTISLIALLRFLSLFTIKNQESRERLIKYTRNFMYPIVFVVDIWLTVMIQADDTMYFWTVYLIYYSTSYLILAFCTFLYIPIVLINQSRGKPTNTLENCIMCHTILMFLFKSYFPLSQIMDVISTILFFQISYLLCSNSRAEQRRKSTLASVFSDIFKSRRVQPDNSSNNNSLNKY
ncbi:hypothetical protein CAEBREN_03336 [Caenorhabditis brenneri]|uniref:Serpentine Receptor, class Z n=1 Tax=Caenorhabditis brenneri TaxID=135651 RepID=G0NJF5_CAEBE|nr:hypothetical protein CAEBREN_03336 [Caenorhabditis brenneri]